MDELEQQTREALDGKPITQNIFPFQVPSSQHFTANLFICAPTGQEALVKVAGVCAQPWAGAPSAA